MNQTLHATIESSLKECQAHSARLQRGEAILAPCFPLTLEHLRSLKEEQVTQLDQFIYRFTKLQDSLARRLLPALYTLLESDTEPRPFLDILSRARGASRRVTDTGPASR